MIVISSAYFLLQSVPSLIQIFSFPLPSYFSSWGELHSLSRWHKFRLSSSFYVPLLSATSNSVCLSVCLISHDASMDGERMQARSLSLQGILSNSLITLTLLSMLVQSIKHHCGSWSLFLLLSSFTLCYNVEIRLSMPFYFLVLLHCFRLSISFSKSSLSLLYQTHCFILLTYDHKHSPWINKMQQVVPLFLLNFIFSLDYVFIISPSSVSLHFSFCRTPHFSI